jgi:quinolinate synthase
VREADQYGSTEAIIKAVAESAPGTSWAVGTEINLVERLARQHPDKKIELLADSCLCATMAAVTPVNLLWILDKLKDGQVVNRIQVDQEVAEKAEIALNRMLAI